VAEPCPGWLADLVRSTWDIDVSGCNYDCKHCYLGLKEFAGLDWPARERILSVMRGAGVLWLQLTGGEPMIDKLFAATYSRAFDLGMMIEVLTNGSRLSNPAILDLLTSRPPHRVTLSVYGSTEASYDGLTRRRGAYKSFMKGLNAAREAGIALDLSIVVTKDNAHEVDAMHAMAESLGIGHRDYHNMSPTIYGGAESLPSQSLRRTSRRGN
jgi:MoaA/NifB/PqqE/SkfB family radical SAM enzyme